MAAPQASAIEADKKTGPRQISRFSPRVEDVLAALNPRLIAKTEATSLALCLALRFSACQKTGIV